MLFPCTVTDVGEPGGAVTDFCPWTVTDVGDPGGAVRDFGDIPLGEGKAQSRYAIDFPCNGSCGACG